MDIVSCEVSRRLMNNAYVMTTSGLDLGVFGNFKIIKTLTTSDFLKDRKLLSKFVLTGQSH